MEEDILNEEQKAVLEQVKASAKDHSKSVPGRPERPNDLTDDENVVKLVREEKEVEL